VIDQSAVRTSEKIAGMSRRRFLGRGVGASALLAAVPFPGTVAERLCCPSRPVAAPAYQPASLMDLAEGRRLAMAVAQRSGFVMRTVEAVRTLAAALPDPVVRGRTLDLLENPAPTYQLRSPSATDRDDVRQELLTAGLIPESTTVDGIFPPVADPWEAPQPFWSAPGSGFQAHHAYPGGLAVHELGFARTAAHYRETYGEVYDLEAVPGAIDGHLLTGVSLWHDIQKVTVFQWLPDGSELVEQTIADTGAHHTLGGAEAIVRGMSPEWVTSQLCAHDAPTLVQLRPGEAGRQRVVNYIRAAAIIARVDPVSFGLLRRTKDGGFVLRQDPPRIEDYIINFADGDYLFTNDAIPLLVSTLAEIATGYGIDPTNQTARFNLFRNLVLSQLSEVRLYGILQQEGADGMRALIDRDVDLDQLRG
jgi:hypothetical protein